MSGTELRAEYLIKIDQETETRAKHKHKVDAKKVQNLDAWDHQRTRSYDNKQNELQRGNHLTQTMEVFNVW